MATVCPILSALPTHKPGNGLCVFFYDAGHEFYPGGIGSSLGYTNYIGPIAFNSNVIPSSGSINGMTGAYIGIGLDVTGDYSTCSDGKTGDRYLGVKKYSGHTIADEVSSRPIHGLNPNSVSVRMGEISSYSLHSVTSNLNTYPLDHEKYNASPPVTLHQNVTSRDDVSFTSARITLQNRGQRVKVEFKNPVDGKFYTYHVTDLDNAGLGAGSNPTLLRAGLSFATSDYVTNCEIKNFTVYGNVESYIKLASFLEPATGTNFTVRLSGDPVNAV